MCWIRGSWPLITKANVKISSKRDLLLPVLRMVDGIDVLSANLNRFGLETINLSLHTSVSVRK